VDNGQSTLGRFDVTYTIQTMARFSVASKQEHLKRTIIVFECLKNHAKHGIMVDTRERMTCTTEDVVFIWQEQYTGATKELPLDMHTLRERHYTLQPTWIQTMHMIK